MITKVRIIGLVFLTLTLNLSAKEGMWIPSTLNKLLMDDMKSMGLNLTADEIYAINKSSLKDAIFQFGGGCTSEIISSKGLLLTNHHCGYGTIQRLSSFEKDYLKNGYWAMNHEEEIPAPGLTAMRVVALENITDKVMANIPADTPEEQRAKAVSDYTNKLGEQITKSNHYEFQVKEYYEGLEYWMILTETFKDVRFVGAPPSSIGKFGYDTDNWVWPRHTGDFSVFRIYTNSENKPAEYSKDNKPYKPLHHLKINMSGVEQDDFTMVYGFPGRTSEYLTSFEIDRVVNQINPARIEMRQKALDIINQRMRESDKVRLQYAAKQSGIANGWKKMIGQNFGLKRNKAVEVKQAEETIFQQKVNANKEAKIKYGNLLSNMKKYQKEIEAHDLARWYFIELYYLGPDLFKMTDRYNKLLSAINLSMEKDSKVSSDSLQTLIGKYKSSLEGQYKNYVASIDRDILAVQLKLYCEGLAPELRPRIYQTIQDKYSGSYSNYIAEVFENSIVTNEQRMTDLLNAGAKKIKKTFEKDPAYLLLEDITATYFDVVKPKHSPLKQKINIEQKQYMQALKELVEYNYFPNANSTLRLAYGKADGYAPMDAVKYRFYTTLEGAMAKEDPDTINREFNVPAKLKQLYEKKDYGPYADKNGDMRVCFLASNHTTGGNSGSPVLDGNGNLVGLNFDRTWESTMSDIYYDPTICRNIAVDIRFVLFTIDKFAGAKWLVDEMDKI